MFSARHLTSDVEMTVTDQPTMDTPHSPLSNTAFKEKLAWVIPHLRAFARGLCGNPDTVDDLVQETMLKA